MDYFKLKNMVPFFLFVFLCFSVFGDSITDYSVKSPVFLDKKVTIIGDYNNDPDPSNGVLCKFLITDENGFAVLRATDEYTFSDSSFFQEITLNDILFKIDTNYTATTTCGNATDSNVFLVLNREPFTDVVSNWWLYAFTPDNYLTLFILGIGLFIVFLLFMAWKAGHNIVGNLKFKIPGRK